jgi:membrane peptidoglycan carboxypeptidase
MRAHRFVAVAVALVLGGALVAIGAALVATPGVGDLATRVERHAPGAGTREIGLGSVTRMTVDALVATEDERFWSNSGIDVIGLLRAIPYDATHLSLAQGGSTLTEQLAKNLWLGGRDENAWAKLEDMALALKLDQRYPKDTILADYLDTAYFGQGAYGIDSASHRYFGVAPRALDAGEATLLVGLVQAPTSYDPYTHPAEARLRQVDVLRSLVRVGTLPAARAAALLAQPLRLADGRTLPGVRGVDLASGPAADWAAFAGAIAVALLGLAAALARRLVRLRHPLAGRVVLLAAVCLLGTALVVAVRSLRVI